MLATMALHGYGLDWRQALKTDDHLINSAKASDTQTSDTDIESGKASLVISVAGVPNFPN